MRLPSLFPAATAAVAAISLFFGASPSSAAAIMASHDAVVSAGTLSLEIGQSLFSFRYSTPNPSPTNWIGIYSTYYGGPDNQEFVAGSLAWAYAPSKSGEVQVNVSDLSPGYYRAFFLAQDGYQWLSQPIDVMVPGSGPIEFINDRIITQNARQGSPFKAKLGRLIANPKDSKTKFAKVTSFGADWVHVAKDGTISGTPGRKDKTTNFMLQATATDGSSATIHVQIPVRPAGERLVEEIKVMSFNMWFGGTNVNDYHNKQVRFLINSNVDIVGLQESWNGQATRLAQALGWYYWQSPNEVGIISRYPIVETFPEQAAGGSIRIELDGRRTQLMMWNVHLGYNPYGPYDFCFDRMPLGQVLNREYQSGRTPQIMEIVSAMQDALSEADDIPVILTGDFNAPSHLDWTEATKKAHCGYGFVPWPSSEFPIQSGLIDSFREAHPDPNAEPGITWSPIYLDNGGRSEPLDRIDFVYHKGQSLKVLRSETLVAGEPTPEPDQRNNEWTSDHAAVMTTFKLGEADGRAEL
ncbi:exonuclease iii [Trichoderma arundinaceum]|uniref:Exonuclease iii n=1 Tax=Trichoderma arundinaceum TaxID=490622 RepID=A0A395P0V7_TRIAR|nr:exonuclease iii [Trichoderma arundinaceum]